MTDDWEMEVTDTGRNLFMVLFSPPGFGKTILASRIAQLSGKSLILTDESGHKALNDFPELAANTKVRVYRTKEDIAMALQRRAQGKSDFDTLIFDTFTGIQKKQMRFYMTKELGPGKPNPQYFDVKRNDPDVPAQQDYLKAESTWYPIMQGLATQDDVNIILNCHIQHPNPEKIIPGDVTRPKLPDAIWQLVNGKANVVAYLDRTAPGNDGEVRRLVQVQATNKLAGKSQIRTLKPRMWDDDFVEAIREWQSR